MFHIHLRGDHQKYMHGPGSVFSTHSDDEYITVEDLV